MGRSILASILCSVAVASVPDPGDYAETARWLVANLNYGVLSSVSARSAGTDVGDPFGNPYAFADVGGVPYFYATGEDASMKDFAAGNNRASFGLSEAQFTGSNTVAACDVTTRGGDPESPPCARLVLAGEWSQLAEGTDEQVAAKAALFAKHPSFPLEPHNFFVGKIDVDSIWILTGYGGIPPVTPAEYFAATAAPILRVQQKEETKLTVFRDRPKSVKKVSTARWMVETLNWGFLSTISTRSESSVVGDPFVNPNAVAGGEDGSLYFFVSPLDSSIQDIQVNARASFSMTEAQMTGTANEVPMCVIGASAYGDPENPPCARLVFTGNYVNLNGTSEESAAKAALFARHPSYRFYPADFYPAKLDIDAIWFIDIYGGATIMPPADYLSWTADADAMVV